MAVWSYRVSTSVSNKTTFLSSRVLEQYYPFILRSFLFSAKFSVNPPWNSHRKTKGQPNKVGLIYSWVGCGRVHNIQAQRREKREERRENREERRERERERVK